MKRILPYNPKLKDRAKELRKAGILSEVLLWQELKSRKFLNLDFDRQKVIGNYIVDFYCDDLRLVIEIDEMAQAMMINKNMIVLEIYTY